MSQYIRTGLGASSGECCTSDQISQAVIAGVMPVCPCPEDKPTTPAAAAPTYSWSWSKLPTKTKVVIGAGALVVGYLLLRKKR